MGVALFHADSGGDGRTNIMTLGVAFRSCALNVPDNCGLVVLPFKALLCGSCEIFLWICCMYTYVCLNDGDTF